MEMNTAPTTSNQVDVLYVKHGTYSGLWFKSHPELEAFMEASKRESEAGKDFSWLRGMRLRVVTRQNWTLMQKLMADPQIVCRMDQPVEQMLPSKEMTDKGEELRQAYAAAGDLDLGMRNQYDPSKRGFDVA